MAARHVAQAQRLAPGEQHAAPGEQHAAPGGAVAQRITWGELGCPADVGTYRVGGSDIRVKRIHIIVAENDPAAVFTVVTFSPPLGPPEVMLGHRVL